MFLTKQGRYAATIKMQFERKGAKIPVVGEDLWLWKPTAFKIWDE